MKLIKEDCDFSEMSCITEAKGGKKRLYITGPFLQYDKMNRNKRVYSKRVMESAVNDYTRDYIDQKRSLGELNHPAEPIVNPERAAIRTESLKPVGKYYYEGKAMVLSTPMGKIVENLLDDGCKVGVSSRGLGSLRPHRDGYNEVGDDFRLTTAADVVFDPSAQEAFVEGVFEAAEWIFESGAFRLIDLEYQREQLRQANMARLQEQKLMLLKKFLGTL